MLKRELYAVLEPVVGCFLARIVHAASPDMLETEVQIVGGMEEYVGGNVLGILVKVGPGGGAPLEAGRVCAQLRVGCGACPAVGDVVLKREETAPEFDGIQTVVAVCGSEVKTLSHSVLDHRTDTFAPHTLVEEGEMVEKCPSAAELETVAEFVDVPAGGDVAIVQVAEHGRAPYP